MDSTLAVKTKSPRNHVKQTKPSTKPMITLQRSEQMGMGAIPFAGGVAFRVWAPNATAVFVTGTFNEWSDAANPLASEGNGYWSTDVAAAQRGDEYRYLIHHGDQKLSRMDPYAREVTNSVGNARVPDFTFDWGNDDFTLPAWNELVIYEMHIGTFHSKGEGAPGTFYSAIEKLPYLQQLGINVVEIMPSAEFPGALSWGYNPSHPFALESDYGGPTGFRSFVKACHEHGIGVIVDVVYNHFGPSDLDLWCFDGWCENDGGGIYFYNDWRAQTPWGATRPDYGRSEVRQYIRDNALMWFHEYHVDGLRWDATAYIHNIHGNGNPNDDLPDGWALMQWVNQEVHTIYPNALMIAEDLRLNEWITKDGSAGGLGFGAQWDAHFVHPVRETILAMNDADRDLERVRTAILHRYEHKAFARVIYSESHDEVANGKARIPEAIAPGQADSYFARKRSTLAAALVLTSPGIPMLFQGQEFLEDRWFADTDPLDWSLHERYPGIQRLYQDLLHLRRNHHGRTAGLCGPHVDVYHLDQANKVIAFHRWETGGPGDSVAVIANFSNQPLADYPVRLPTGGEWQIRFNSDSHFYGEDFSNIGGAVVTAQATAEPFYSGLATIAIGPYTVLILSQETG